MNHDSELSIGGAHGLKSLDHEALDESLFRDQYDLEEIVDLILEISSACLKNVLLCECLCLEASFQSSLVTLRSKVCFRSLLFSDHLIGLLKELPLSFLLLLEDSFLILLSLQQIKCLLISSAMRTPDMLGIPMRGYPKEVSHLTLDLYMTLLEDPRDDLSIVLLCSLHTSEVKVMTLNAPKVLCLFYSGISKRNEFRNFIEACSEFMFVCASKSEAFAASTTL
jgi:hypothetical protein